MRSAMAIIAAAFLILLTVYSEAVTQRAMNTVHGMVKLRSSVGLHDLVRIRLVKLGMTVQEALLRDNTFTFSNVEQGRYTLIAEAPGFETVRQKIDVPTDWLMIELHPHRNAEPRTEAVPVWELRVPKSARRQFEAARTDFIKNDCTSALEHLKKAIRIYAEYGAAHEGMGECYAQLNQLEAAEQEFKRALEQPHVPEVHLLLGKIYFRQGKRSL
ncbi:MAG TPA: tetratricopeptide repeat protein, partial [Pyrinomonadaceae bacterium]|nr:tetratricopeptide repeat protein [Pyrinomonadaceae bacterium]